jgi:hypothetical protein
MKMDFRLFKLVSGGRVNIYFFCLSMLFRWFSLLGKQAVARLHRCAQDPQHYPSRDYIYSFVHQIITDTLSGWIIKFLIVANISKGNHFDCLIRFHNTSLIICGHKGNLVELSVLNLDVYLLLQVCIVFP